MVRVKVKLPAELTPGTMRVVVSDGATVDRLTTRTGMQQQVGLADMVASMNRMHANDRVYVTLLDHATQAVLEGEALPGVPLSMANVLEPLKDAQKMQLTSESVVEAGSLFASEEPSRSDSTGMARTSITTAAAAASGAGWRCTNAARSCSLKSAQVRARRSSR